jgi:hypothetical protein
VVSPDTVARRAPGGEGLDNISLEDWKDSESDTSAHGRRPEQALSVHIEADDINSLDSVKLCCMVAPPLNVLIPQSALDSYAGVFFLY